MATVADKSLLTSQGGPELEANSSPTLDAAEKGNIPSNPDLVDWDGEDDPEKPVNWSSKKKWTNGGLLAAMTFVTYEAKFAS